MKKQITIKGITYNIVSERIVNDETTDLTLQRPNGKVLYGVNRFTDPKYQEFSEVMSYSDRAMGRPRF